MSHSVEILWHGQCPQIPILCEVIGIELCGLLGLIVGNSCGYKFKNHRCATLEINSNNVSEILEYFGWDKLRD